MLVGEHLILCRVVCSCWSVIISCCVACSCWSGNISCCVVLCARVGRCLFHVMLRVDCGLLIVSGSYEENDSLKSWKAMLSKLRNSRRMEKWLKYPST